MNNKEAVKALLDGRKVRGIGDPSGYYLELKTCDEVRSSTGGVWGRLGALLGDSYADVIFELFVPPATDEELIAEMGRLGAGADVDGAIWIANTYKHCAAMLRTRKVNP